MNLSSSHFKGSRDLIVRSLISTEEGERDMIARGVARRDQVAAIRSAYDLGAHHQRQNVRFNYLGVILMTEKDRSTRRETP